MRATLQSIFKIGYAAYRRAFWVPAYIHKAAWSIMNCRTARLGGHRQVCPDGHFERNHYNSCGHRMCPQCAFLRVQKWLVRQRERLLACMHYHIIMTVPHDLNPLWRLNPQAMGEIYFRAVRETLFALLGDDKFMGARPGIIAALHTGTKTLALHPHIHCLVTGGGIKDGEWVKCKKKILLPYRVVSNLFRGKVRAFTLEALDKGRLMLPEGSRLQAWKNELNRLGRVKWSVRVMERYSHGRGVMSYLARKVRGGPILNSRIISVSEKSVVFHVDRDAGETMSLTPFEFIERYIQHVLPTGFISVRNWGLYSNSARAGDFAQCRSFFGQPEYECDAAVPGWEEVLSGSLPDGGYRVMSCPVCGKFLEMRPLREAVVFCASRAPPGEMDCAA